MVSAFLLVLTVTWTTFSPHHFLFAESKPEVVNQSKNNNRELIENSSCTDQEIVINKRYTAGSFICSDTSPYQFGLTPDGDLCVHRNFYPIACVGVEGGESDVFMVMQRDGNLVVYGKDGAVWASNTSDNRGAVLTIGNTGVAYIAREGDNEILWETPTPTGNPPPEIPPQTLNCVDNQTTKSKKYTKEEFICSPNGQYHFGLMTDGNLCLMQGPDNKLWCADTCCADYKSMMVMQSDGNLVVYTALSGGKALWASNTNGKGASFLKVSDTGIASIESSSGKVFWSTPETTNPLPPVAPPSPAPTTPDDSPPIASPSESSTVVPVGTPTVRPTPSPSTSPVVSQPPFMAFLPAAGSSCRTLNLDASQYFCPTMRYCQWNFYHSNVRQFLEQKVGYSQNGWNYIQKDAVDGSSYDSLNSGVKSALNMLGYDEDMHDCCNNLYADYDWSDFDSDQLSLLRQMGYNANSWNNAATIALDDFWWDELPSAIQDGLYQQFCYNRELWNEVPLTNWATGANFQVPGIM